MGFPVFRSLVLVSQYAGVGLWPHGVNTLVSIVVVVSLCSQVSRLWKGRCEMRSMSGPWSRPENLHQPVSAVAVCRCRVLLLLVVCGWWGVFG